MATRWQQNYQIYKRYVRNLALIYQKRQDLKIFTELLLTLSVIVIFGVFAIRPTIVTIVTLNKSIDDKKDTIAQLDSKIQSLIEAQALYDRNIAGVQLINQAIPGDPYPVLYARQIEGLAKRHSLYILGMNTEDIPLVAGIATDAIVEQEAVVDPTLITDKFPATASSFVFEMNFSGDYSNVNSFIADLENMRMPMYKDNLSISTTQGELPGELILTVSGRLPYLPQ